MARVRILVTNDDGIASPGIHAVATALGALGEVWIVAPMAGSTFRRPSTTLVHRRIRQTLHRELETLPSGMPVRIFSPTRESSEVMGLDLMSEDRTAETILAGFLEAGDPRRSA